MKSIITNILFLMAIFPENFAIVNIDEETKRLIEGFVESAIFDCPQHDIVSMNPAVVYQGEVAYTTAYGVKDLGKNAMINRKSKGLMAQLYLGPKYGLTSTDIYWYHNINPLLFMSLCYFSARPGLGIHGQ